MRRKELDPTYEIPQRPEFSTSYLDLKYGEIFDAGIQYYGEFFANLEFAWDLLHMGTVTLDGQPGTVRVVARYTNVIQLKWTPN